MHVHKTGFQGSRISKYRQEIRDACSQGTLAILQQTFGKKVVSGDKIVRVEAAVVLSYLQEEGLSEDSGVSCCLMRGSVSDPSGIVSESEFESWR
eukprot:1141018-Pelagomonas_calceolata.AAC.2